MLFPLVWLGLTTTSHGGMLDAHLDLNPVQAGITIHSQQSGAQTFTVEHGGILDRVEIQVWRASSPTEPLVLEVRRTDNFGDPDMSPASLVATLSFPPAMIPATSFITAQTGMDLGAQSFAVAPGDHLAIVATAANSGLSGADDSYYWAESQPVSAYPGGARYAVFGTTVVATGFDYGFRTYVTIPEPSSIALAAVALVGLVALGRCKRA